MSRYLIYARVSPKGSKWDSNETSIPVQVAECKAHVLRLDPYAEFEVLFDERYSGKDLNRPAVQILIDQLKNGTANWQCLVVWHMDRLSRSLADSIPLLKQIQSANKGLISVRQELDFHTAGGRFSLHIFMAAAQYEREMTSERTKAKMLSMCEKGLYVGGSVVMGYKKDPNNKYLLIPDEPKASYVRMIFEEFASDKLTKQRLKDFGLSRSGLYAMLRRQVYAGKIVFGGKVYQGQHEPLVTQELFDQVQHKIGQTTKDYAPRRLSRNYTYELSGLVHCGRCGALMTPTATKKKERRYFYYACRNEDCGNRISAPDLDETVLAALVEKLRNANFVEHGMTSFMASQMVDKDLEQNITDLTTKRSHLETKQKRLLELLMIEGAVQAVIDAVNKEMTTVTNQLTEVISKLEELTQKKETTIHAIEASMMVRQAIQHFINTTDFTQPLNRSKLTAIIDDIVVHERQHINISIVPGLISSPNGEVWCPDETLGELERKMKLLKLARLIVLHFSVKV